MFRVFGVGGVVPEVVSLEISEKSDSTAEKLGAKLRGPGRPPYKLLQHRTIFQKTYTSFLQKEAGRSLQAITVLLFVLEHLWEP